MLKMDKQLFHNQILEDFFINARMACGEGMCPITRILYDVGTFITVFLVITLFKTQFYLPALLLLVATFFSSIGRLFSIPLLFFIGPLIFFGVLIHFVIIQYWVGVVLIATFFVIAWISDSCRRRNIKKILYYQKVKVDPSEGLEKVPYIIFQVAFFVFALFTHGILSIIFWVLFGLVTFLKMVHYYYRFASPWRRLHFPLMYRYATISGYYAAVVQGENEKINRDTMLKEFVKGIYPNLSTEEIEQFLNSIYEKIENFIDKPIIVDILKKKNPSLDIEKLNETLAKIQEYLRGIYPIWIIAEIIEREYGKEERIKYLQAVISGTAF